MYLSEGNPLGNKTALLLLRTGAYKEHPIKPLLIAYSNNSYCTKDLVNKLREEKRREGKVRRGKGSMGSLCCPRVARVRDEIGGVY